MQRYQPSMIAVATALAMLAGFVDALAYIGLGGFFASFMSGNTTRLGVGLGTGAFADARSAGALILAFLAGVMLATIVADRFVEHRKAAVMAMVTLLLALVALFAPMTRSHLPMLLLATAMGAENGVFNREGEVSIGLTYMTGTLVRIGQRLAAALIGRGTAFAWLRPLVLWTGFAVGVVVGARIYGLVGFGALWLAAAGAGVMTLVLAALTRRFAEA